MSNPEKLSHWKSLATLLGTEPPAESGPTQRAPPTSQPASPPVSTTKPTPPRPPDPPRPAPPKPAPPRRESNWGKLAGILGLAGSPAPETVAEKPKPVLEPVREPIAPEPPPVTRSASQNSEAAALAASHWDATDPDAERVIDPLEMTSDPFIDETLDAIDLESIEDRESVPEPGSGDRPRRRRRRGRGRGRGRRPEGEVVPQGQPPSAGFDGRSESETIDIPTAASEAAGEVVAYGGEVSDADSADRPTPRANETEEERETRHRRRRRGRGRRGRREEGSAEADRPPRKREEPAAAVPAPIRTQEDMDDADDDDLLDAIEHEDELGDDEDKGEDSQFSHKKIPSWQEAIEAVIATNMTSRANNPSAGSRGGRGRGRRDR